MSTQSGETSGKKLITFDFRFMEKYTKYPYVLAIPQHVTEAAFEEAIREREKRSHGGLRFTRGTRVVDVQEKIKVTEDGKVNGFVVTFDNGQKAWSRYVVGADGSRSTVNRFVQSSSYVMTEPRFRFRFAPMLRYPLTIPVLNQDSSLALWER